MRKIVCLCVLAMLCIMVQPTVICASEPESGTWGDNITWKYEDGVLTFSGVGEMEESSGQNPRPWRIYAEDVTTVIVEEGITMLTNNMVQGFDRLTTVSLPEGLTEISSIAFSMCTNLHTINIPSTVKTIGSASFNECTSLKSIKLPDGLELIFMDAFRNCTALESITFPATLTLLDGFSNCTSLKTIYFQGDAIMGASGAFQNVTATVYYPRGNTTWEAVISQDYMGNLTWEPYCGSNHAEETVAAVAPGCTTTGLTEGKVCKYCDEVLQAQEVIPATGIHTFGEWEIVDSSAEGVLVERSCETCGHTEQKLLEESYPPQTDPSDAPTNPENVPTEPSGTPTEPTDAPTEPTGTPTEPTQTPTDAPTEPTQVPADPTQPDITVTEDPKPFPWAIVSAVAAVAAPAAGILLGRKRK